MHRNRCRSRRNAQSIVETVVGIIFLIPIVLFLFDIAVLVLGNTANDHLAKAAARAAASATDPATGSGSAAQAVSAAQSIVNNFANSALISGHGLWAVAYNPGTVVYPPGAVPSPGSNPSSPAGPANIDPGAGNCSATTWMYVKVPVPFPGLANANYFYARDVEPIVSIPPQ